MLIYVIYWHMQSSDPGNGWYFYTVPPATFISCYSLWRWKTERWQSIINIMTSSAFLTLVSHGLNIIIIYVYAIVALTAQGKRMSVEEIILFIPVGFFASLIIGGLMTFCIFLFSGGITLLLFRQLKKNNFSKANNVDEIKNTTGDSA